jgi:hypothetical protein
MEGVMKHFLVCVFGLGLVSAGLAGCADVAEPTTPVLAERANELCMGDCTPEPPPPPPPSPFEQCMAAKANLPAASLFGQCVSCCQQTCVDRPCANTCSQVKCAPLKQQNGKGR